MVVTVAQGPPSATVRRRRPSSRHLLRPSPLWCFEPNHRAMAGVHRAFANGFSGSGRVKSQRKPADGNFLTSFDHKPPAFKTSGTLSRKPTTSRTCSSSSGGIWYGFGKILGNCPSSQDMYPEAFRSGGDSSSVSAVSRMGSRGSRQIAIKVLRSSRVGHRPRRHASDNDPRKSSLSSSSGSIAATSLDSHLDDTAGNPFRLCDKNVT